MVPANTPFLMASNPAGGAPWSEPRMSSAAWASEVRSRGLVAQGLGYNNVCNVMPKTFNHITPAAAAQAYYAGLDQGGARVDSRRDDGASRQELVAVAEFGAWLQHLPAWWGRNLCTVVPEDMVAFMESHWVHHHGRTFVGDDPAPVASASGAKGVLLDLEHYFAALGRSGEWNVALLGGNPCRSFVVKQWCRGYKRNQRVAGVCPVAATPRTVVPTGRNETSESSSKTKSSSSMGSSMAITPRRCSWLAGCAGWCDIKEKTPGFFLYPVNYEGFFAPDHQPLQVAYPRAQAARAWLKHARGGGAFSEDA